MKAAECFPWPEDAVAELRRRWEEAQESAGQIGAVLKISRRAVIGKAHRLGLSRRPSPIRRREDRPAAPARVRAKTFLPALPSQETDTSVGAAVPAVFQPAPEGHAEQDVGVPAPSPGETDRSTDTRSAVVTPAPGTPVAAGCQWPISDPRSPDFRFCGAPRAAGRSYCPEHCAAAFVAPGSRSPWGFA